MRKYLLMLGGLVSLFATLGCAGTREWIACKDPRCTICAGAGSTRCDKCNGDGGSKETVCRYCKGNPSIVCTTCNGTGQCNICQGKTTIRCARCHGRGKVMLLIKCNQCGGSGQKDCEACPLVLFGTNRGACRACKGETKFICTHCQNGKIVTVCDKCEGKGQIRCPNGHLE